MNIKIDLKPFFGNIFRRNFSFEIVFQQRHLSFVCNCGRIYSLINWIYYIHLGLRLRNQVFYNDNNNKNLGSFLALRFSAIFHVGFRWFAYWKSTDYARLNFSLQPNLDTRRKQLDAWCSLLLDYCRLKKVCTFDVNDASKFPLFSNAKINRKNNENDFWMRRLCAFSRTIG